MCSHGRWKAAEDYSFHKNGNNIFSYCIIIKNSISDDFTPNELHCKALLTYNNLIFSVCYVWVLQLSGKLIVFYINSIVQSTAIINIRIGQVL